MATNHLNRKAVEELCERIRIEEDKAEADGRSLEHQTRKIVESQYEDWGSPGAGHVGSTNLGPN